MLCTQVVHEIGNYKTALSEGAALAVVVEAIPGNPHRTGVGTDSPSPPRQSVVRRQLALSAPRTARRGAAREGVMVEGATPCILPLARHRAGGGGARQNPPPPLPFLGVAPSTVIPGGKAIDPPPRRTRWLSPAGPRRRNIIASARRCRGCFPEVRDQRQAVTIASLCHNGAL